MSALKESGDIEYNADVTLSLVRPEKPAVPAPPGQTVLELRVDKNRSGLTGRPLSLLLHGDLCRVEEAER
jgi:replicative DNA helicase